MSSTLYVSIFLGESIRIHLFGWWGP